MMIDEFYFLPWFDADRQEFPKQAIQKSSLPVPNKRDYEIVRPSAVAFSCSTTENAGRG